MKKNKNDNNNEETKNKKTTEGLKSNGVGCQTYKKIKGKVVKNKAKLKIVQKGIIISSPPENDKKIPWDKIVSAERWTFNSLKINLVDDIVGIESPVIYLTNCYSTDLIVPKINELAEGEDLEGWS